MNKKTRSVSEMLTRVIIVFLCGILAIGVLTLCSVLQDEFGGYNEAAADDFFYAVQQGDYGWLLRLSQRPMSDKTREEAAGCLAAADYYEAAVWYKVYSDNGREEEAKQYSSQMEALLPSLQSNSLSFVAEDVRELLELE